MMTDDIAVPDASRTFPMMDVSAVHNNFPADRDTFPALQLADRDERHGLPGEDAATTHIASRSASELCHDVAMFAAVVTVIAILLPHLLRFAHVRF